MTDDPTRPARDDDEDITGRLLRLAGPRPTVPDDRTFRVRAVVRAHWAGAVRKRRVRRWAVGGAVLTAAAALVLFVTRSTMPPAAPPEVPGDPLARVERVEGPVPLAAGELVRQGAWIETGEGRIGVRLSAGASVRVDRHTRTQLVSPTVVELAEGTVYLDSDGGSGFEVRTPLGTAHDVGTQFEVHVEAERLRLRVRSGRVALRTGTGTEVAEPGTEIAVVADTLERRAIRVDGPDWRWVIGLGPVFRIEGQALSAFIDHLSREHGWQVTYADEALRRDAEDIILHGSVDGLSPRDALTVTTATSGLDFSLDAGTLFVFKPPPSR